MMARASERTYPVMNVAKPIGDWYLSVAIHSFSESLHAANPSLTCTA